MKNLLFVLAIFAVLNGNAQPFLISFAGTGASATVNTVKVENLKSGLTITLNGGDILRLSAATGVNSIENKQSGELNIYPNPTTGNSTVEVRPPVAGEAVISVYEMTGKPVAQVHSYLENYTQEFSLSGIKNGFYLVSVEGNNYHYSGKLLCNGQANGTISINIIVNNQEVAENNSKSDNKGTQATVDMAYTAGDRLKFTAISGNYITVKTAIPTQDNTISFKLIPCSDGDMNNYPVVEIGTQTWMAENLKTTKYNDGTIIPLVTDSVSWVNIITHAYCWYKNDETTYKAVYGALYNWYSVSTSKLCPIGWHVPNEPEWVTLTDYFGGTFYSGGKLKETGTTHWILSAGATNEVGYTARPGGARIWPGRFEFLGGIGFWWTATEDNASSGSWDEEMQGGFNTMKSLASDKFNGFSVRCLKN